MRVGETTLHRWLRDAHFAKAYRQAISEMIRAALGSMQQAAPQAPQTLRDVMSDGPPSTSVAAARAVLDVEIRECLTAIEKTLTTADGKLVARFCRRVNGLPRAHRPFGETRKKLEKTLDHRSGLWYFPNIKRLRYSVYGERFALGGIAPADRVPRTRA